MTFACLVLGWGLVSLTLGVAWALVGLRRGKER